MRGGGMKLIAKVLKLTHIPINTRTLPNTGKMNCYQMLCWFCSIKKKKSKKVTILQNKIKILNYQTHSR